MGIQRKVWVFCDDCRAEAWEDAANDVRSARKAAFDSALWIKRVKIADKPQPVYKDYCVDCRTKRGYGE